MIDHDPEDHDEIIKTRSNQRSRVNASVWESRRLVMINVCFSFNGIIKTSSTRKDPGQNVLNCFWELYSDHYVWAVRYLRADSDSHVLRPITCDKLVFLLLQRNANHQNSEPL